MNKLFYLFLFSICFGCISKPQLLPSTKEVLVRVIDSKGAPIKNLTITLQPTEYGYAVLTTTDINGELREDFIPGKYVYYFSSRTPGLKIPKGYDSPNMEHSVQIDEKEVVLKLDTL